MTREIALGQWTFTSRAALEREIKVRLAQPNDVIFRDALLEAVVNTMHPEVAEAGQKTTGQFRFLSGSTQERAGMPTAKRFRYGRMLTAYFVPIGGWWDVSAYPWRRPKPAAEIGAALREIANQNVVPKPDPDDRCAVPDCSGPWSALEYDHVTPTWREIAAAALRLCTQEEIATRFGYQKFVAGVYTVADCIPPAHPGIRYVLDAHRTNQWRWCCRFHHRGVRE